MKALQVAQYLENYKEYLFPNDLYTEEDIQNAMLSAPHACEMRLNTIKFKKPSTLQIIAVFPGSIGVDRFMLGDIGKGILKYFTVGGFGIWWIADICSAKKRCRNRNCKLLMELIEKFPQETQPISENDFSSLDDDFSEMDSNFNTITTNDSTTFESTPANANSTTLNNGNTVDKQKVITTLKAAGAIGKALKDGFKDIQNSMDVK